MAVTLSSALRPSATSTSFPRHVGVAVLQLRARERHRGVRADHAPQPVGAEEHELVLGLEPLRAELGQPAQPHGLAPRQVVDVAEGARHLEEAREPTRLRLGLG